MKTQNVPTTIGQHVKIFGSDCISMFHWKNCCLSCCLEVRMRKEFPTISEIFVLWHLAVCILFMQSDISSIDYKIKIFMNSEEPSCSLLCSIKCLDKDLILYVKINMHILSLV